MNKRILEYWDSNKINGEYWILGGEVEFADGDVGDETHESIAAQAVFSKFADAVYDLADECEISIDRWRHDGCDVELISKLIYQIRDYLQDEKQMPNPNAYIQQEIHADNGAYAVLCGGDAKEYYMRNFGAIAVRGNDIELYGYNRDRAKEIASGIDDILERSSFDDNIPDEEIELYIYDYKTKRSFGVTLADLKNLSVRPQQLPDTKGHSKFHIHTPDSAENYFRKGIPKQPTQKLVPGQDAWRGTSEGFKHWFKMVTNESFDQI